MESTNAPDRVTCPRCGALAPMLPIVFGFPMADLFEAEQRGEIVLGGCVVDVEDPTHRCSACGRDVILAQDPVELCASCGRPLIDDPEDDPTGDAGLPICGECNRSRNFAAIEELDLLGGRDD